MRRLHIAAFTALAATLLLSSACKKTEEAEATTENQEEVAEALEGAVDEAVPTTEDGEVAVEVEPPAEAAGEQQAAPAAVEATGTASSEAIVGSWSLNLERTVANLREEERAMAMQMMGQMDMRMVFQADGNISLTVAAQGQEQSREATYTTANASGSTMDLTITPEDMPAEEAVVTFIDDNTIQIAPPEGTAANQPPMVLTRVTGE